MPKSKLKTNKKLPNPATQFKAILKAAAEGIRPIVETDARKRQQIVADWENQPDFVPQVIIKAGGVGWGVFIGNPDQFVEGKSSVTAGDLWEIWNRGTAPHEIVADEGSVLHFEVNGEEVYTRRVYHPGTEAHNDDIRITQETDQEVTLKLREAIRVALRRF